MTGAVVIGGGPGAVRAAATLRKLGRSVVLLQEGAVPGQVVHPDVPVGRGVSEAPSDGVLGPMSTVEAERAVLARGHVIRLPLKPNHVFRMMSPTVHPEAARALAQTRASVALRELIGGGRELRSYEDWVVQRFGRPIFENLHASYCRRRFGEPGEVSANAARHAHAPRSVAEVAPARGAAASWQGLIEGLDLRTGVAVTRLEPHRVHSNLGSFEGDIFVDIAPARVAAWLGDAVGIRAEVERLRHRHAIEVVVAGGAALPRETHVFDTRAAFFRLLRVAELPGGAGDALVAHYAVEDDDPRWHAADADLVAATVAALRQIGVEDAAPGSARVRRIREHHPVWVRTHTTRMRSYTLALAPLGITPVGRAGLFGMPTWAQELGWVESAGDGGLRERMRRWVEPPLDGLADPATLAQFVQR